MSQETESQLSMDEVTKNFHLVSPKSLGEEISLETSDTSTVISTSAPQNDQQPEVNRKFPRLRALDNARTVLIFIIVMQHAIIETASNTPDAKANFPTQFLLLSHYIGITRTFAIGTLFFISGVSSSFYLAVCGNYISFVFRKAWRTTVYSVGYLVTLKGIQYTFGGDTTILFDILQVGKLSLGPIFYVFLLLIFDFIFAVLKFINQHYHVFGRGKVSKKWFKVAQCFFSGALVLWTEFAVSRLFISPPPWLLPHFHAGPHFPIQYIIAYTAGVQFVWTWRLFLLEVRPSLMVYAFFVRLVLALSTLFALNQKYPFLMDFFMSPITPPQFAFDKDITSKFPVVFYAMWSSLVFLLFGRSFIIVFFKPRRLRTTWGIISRFAYLQIFTHMFFVIGLEHNTKWINDLITRCIIVGVGSVVLGGSTILLPVICWRSVAKFLNGRRRSTRTFLDDEEQVKLVQTHNAI